MSASQFGLENLVAIVDVNGVQADGQMADIMTVEPIADKWRAFGWHAQVVDGNAMAELVSALDQATGTVGQPQVLVCYTQMGKGVPLIEQRPKGHFVRVDPDEWDRALQQLEEAVE